jgi:Domain of unknown function (DUF4335)
MESNHLTTRTYTAPTCTLIVSSKEVQRLRNSELLATPVDFILELDRSELGDLDRVTLQGQPQQLDTLHQVITRYIAELVAKFPLPIAERHNLVVDEAEPSPEHPAPSSQLDPRDDNRSSRSGIIKNLPGLRGSLPQSPSAANPNSSNFEDDKPSISNLLGQWSRSNRPDPRADAHHVPTEPNANIEDQVTTHSPTTPYLTTASDRSLDHHLYLGDLATPTSTERLSVSAIQLFDLAAVLDEYATEHVTTIVQPNSSFSRALIRDRIPEISTPDAARSRLPNLPRIPPQVTQVGQAYHRAPRSRSASFMSGIPWAIAAAIAVGAPLLLLDPNPNFLKDIASKFKTPERVSTKKTTVTKTATGTTATTPGNVTAGVPTPWQQQPVEPPLNTKPLGATTTPTPGKLGTAPLSDSLLGSAQVPTTPGTPSGTANPAIAPNPLATDGVTGASVNTPGTTTTPTPTSGTKPAPVKKTPTTPQTSKIGQLPLEPSAPSKVSLSNRPILTPPSGQPTVANPPSTPIPFDRSGLDEFGRIDPATRQNPKKTAQKVKPKPTVKPQSTTTPTDAGATSPPSFEPLTPIPTNPNLIDPNQNSAAESPDPQAPAIVPNQPLQPNAANFGTDPAEIPSLQESKRFFQGKWKANTTQTSALQYVIQVSGKSGTVQSVTPQGTPATTYLQQTKFIKPGQKFISPAAAGNSDQKIRVLLQPDGNVDAFIEP